MTREDIIRMARQAGMERVVKLHSDGTRTVELPHPDLLTRFAALVAAQEREAVIAQAIEQGFVSESYAEQFRAAIRARGQS
jgi:hypothetical protein